MTGTITSGCSSVNTRRAIPVAALCADNSGMDNNVKTIGGALSERRRARLRQLIDLFFDGNATALGRAVGRSQPMISNVLNRQKGFGERLARDIESRLAPLIPQITTGWLDLEPSQDFGPSGDSLEVPIPTTLGLGMTVAASGTVEIPQLEIVAAAGAGAARTERDDVITVMRVNTASLRAHLGSTPVSSFANLRIVSAHGDSMSPTFESGDLLLIDAGVNEVRVDAVYVLSLRDELYVKRLQRRPDGAFLMLSDNTRYQPYMIADGELEQFQVLGRVLMSWNAKKL